MIEGRFLSDTVMGPRQEREDKNNPCGNIFELENLVELVFSLIQIQMDAYRNIDDRQIDIDIIKYAIKFLFLSTKRAQK